MAKKTRKNVERVAVALKDLPISRAGMKRVQKKVLAAIEAEIGDVEGQDDYSTYVQCFGNYNMSGGVGTPP